MFKELKSLGVVVKELSNELRQLVREVQTSGGRSQETAFLPFWQSVWWLFASLC